MKTKFLSYLLLVFFTIQSCGQSSSKNLNSQENDISTTSVTSYEEEKTIQFLKEFYVAYILECDKPDGNWKTLLSLRNKHLTKNLIKRLDELDLDYDPIIEGQDCDKSWLNTLEVNSEEGQKNVFNICFFYAFENQMKCIRLSVVYDDGNYLIDDFLNDKNLQNSDENTRQSKHFSLDDLKRATWSNDCNSDYSINYVVFDVFGAQFTFPSRFTMTTTLKQVDDTEVEVYFNYPIVRPIPEDMKDCRDYSEEIPIGKIEQLGEKIKFTWYGFYNIKTKNRIHIENPFNNEEYVVLEKCP